MEKNEGSGYLICGNTMGMKGGEQDDERDSK
jgi:hypothetical protein